MPLFADDLDQARLAYEAIEARAQSAEQRAEKLEKILSGWRQRLPDGEFDIRLLRQRVLDLEAENMGLRSELQQIAQLKTDMTLENLIEAIGLAAAVGEASMPDRSIASLTMNMQTYVAPANGGVGIRFQQPELGALAAGLSSTSFEITKVPPKAGVVAPRNLYAVLQDKQLVYSDPFWEGSGPALQIVAEISKIFANTGGWNFAYLIQASSAIASLENSLTAFITQVAPREMAIAYEAAAPLLLARTRALSAKTRPVAGDLFALTSALDATTSIVRILGK